MEWNSIGWVYRSWFSLLNEAGVRAGWFGYRSRRCAKGCCLEKAPRFWRSEEHTSELQSRLHLVCRLLPAKKFDYEPRHAIEEPHVHRDKVAMERRPDGPDRDIRIRLVLPGYRVLRAPRTQTVAVSAIPVD